jgi:hypothetical protein
MTHCGRWTLATEGSSPKAADLGAEARRQLSGVHRTSLPNRQTPVQKYQVEFWSRNLDAMLALEIVFTSITPRHAIGSAEAQAIAFGGGAASLDANHLREIIKKLRTRLD